jgi:type I pantothenate kinase
MTSVLTPLIDHIKGLPIPAMIGITGRVAVGKSTFARTLSDVLADAGCTATVLNTDGYIYPTAELEASDLMSKKGRFQTHDVPSFMSDIELWKRGEVVSIPLYDHGVYDRLPDPATLRPSDILIVEGLLVAHPEVTDALDYRIFLDVTDTAHVYGWFLERCLRLFPGQHQRIEDAWVNINEKTYADETSHAVHKADAVVVFDRSHGIWQITQHS